MVIPVYNCIFELIDLGLVLGQQSLQLENASFVFGNDGGLEDDLVVKLINLI